MADTPTLPQHIDLTPTPQGFRRMRQAMAESILTYTAQIAQIITFGDRLSATPAAVFQDDGVTETEVQWLQEGLSLLVQQKETSIEVLQAGIDEIDRCLALLPEPA